MDEVRLGLVGVGRHGIRYATHLRGGDVTGASLAGICRGNHAVGRDQADGWSIPYFESVEELAGSPEVDALVIVSPSQHHVRAVNACAEAGKPVLVEKPLAPDMDGCEAIARAADSSGIPVMVAQTTRYEGPVIGMFRALPKIGTVRQVTFSLRSEDRTHDEEGVFDKRLDDGGALLDSGVHYFDLLGRMVGEIDEAFCERVHIRNSPIEDAYSALLRAKDGARVVVTMGRWGNSRHEFVEVAGDDGLIHFSRTPPSLELVVGRERSPLPFPDVPGTLVPTLDDFVRVCRREIDPPITIADGASAVRIASACCQSDGRWNSVSRTE